MATLTLLDACLCLQVGSWTILLALTEDTDTFISKSPFILFIFANKSPLYFAYLEKWTWTELS